ncbi:O-acyltransferase like protein-like [Thrips palmi]|uniref:O-acyltransferase like protein-like n=1 Tax=Thrips palmi TaxID=161013 RepID=A0A6P8Y275_THRPL|nr:O-acyltransferase like protein-like [Thrips palmi]
MPVHFERRREGDNMILSAALVLVVAGRTYCDISNDTGTSLSTTPTAEHRSHGMAGAGAEFVLSDLGGLYSVWGHDPDARGVDRIGESALRRLDLLLEMRKHTTSANCREALDVFIEGRAELKLWALKMHFASVVLPDALLSGGISHLGDFDACLSTGATYCLVDVEVRPPSAPASHGLDEWSPREPPNGINATLWDLLKTSGNRRRYRRDSRQWAVCLPEQCYRTAPVGRCETNDATIEESSQLGVLLASTFRGMAQSLGVHLRVNLNPTYCSTSKKNDAAGSFSLRSLHSQPRFLFGSSFILLFPLLVVVASTRYALKKGALMNTDCNKGCLQSMTDCFAMQTNCKDLLRRQSSSLSAIEGMRVITTIGVIAGHRAMFPSGGPVLNPEGFERMYTKMYFINGHIIVCAFFVISAFLDARRCMKLYDKFPKLNLETIMLQLMHRYLRFVAALTVVVAIEALWLEHFGSGPLWNQLITNGEVEMCKTFWWSHLLFINNYFNPSTQCMPHTWYLAAAMHMYFGTPIVMWIIHRCMQRSTSLGCTVLGSLLLVSAGVLYGCTVAFDLRPVTLIIPMFFRHGNFATNANFLNQYIVTHTNLVPYAAGLIFGALHHVIQSREWTPSKATKRNMFLGVVFGLVVQVATIFSGAAYLFVEGRHLWLESMYAPARMVSFSVPIAYIIFACSFGAGGILHRVLSCTPMIALGRLTYSVYLVHLTIILASTASIRQPVYTSDFTFLKSVASDTVLSFLAGLLLYICVEAPLSKLLMAAIEKFASRKRGENVKSDSPCISCKSS